LVTISSGLCCLFAIFDPPFPNYTGGPFLWGRTTLSDFWVVFGFVRLLALGSINA
jgi:hypothetical protein